MKSRASDPRASEVNRSKLIGAGLVPWPRRSEPRFVD